MVSHARVSILPRIGYLLEACVRAEGFLRKGGEMRMKKTWFRARGRRRWGENADGISDCEIGVQLRRSTPMLLL